MKKTVYQTPELRDENDNIIQTGAYGKKSPLVNSTNDGAFDYINNNLEALHDAQTAADTSIETGALTVSGKTTTGTLASGDASVSGTVTATNLTVAGETSVPTASEGNSSNAIANTEFVQKTIEKVVGAAPAALDTLEEIGKALNNDADFAGTMTTELSKKETKSDADTEHALIRQEAQKLVADTMSAFYASMSGTSLPTSALFVGQQFTLDRGSSVSDGYERFVLYVCTAITDGTPTWTTSFLLDPAHAVSCIINTGTVSTNPGTVYGGTWKAIAGGTALISAGTVTDEDGTSRTYTAGQTYGANYSQISVDELPSLKFPYRYSLGGDGTEAGPSLAWSDTAKIENGSGSFSLGGNGYRCNEQKSIALYAWRRQA